MGRPKKTQAASPQEEKPTQAAETQPKEFFEVPVTPESKDVTVTNKTFSEVPAEDSPEYVEYIKSIRVSNDEKKEGKGFGEILKEVNEARKDKARKLKEAAEKRAEEIADGKTVKK